MWILKSYIFSFEQWTPYAAETSMKKNLEFLMELYSLRDIFALWTNIIKYPYQKKIYSSENIKKIHYY